jgi:NADH dehydrogenase
VDGELHEHEYDYLLVATGVSHSFFGHDDWSSIAIGLKTVEDALNIRGKVLRAFEAAESETDDAERRRDLTFVIVGAGATGVELAGALGEMANRTLRSDFRRIDTTASRILLVEAADRVLPTYPPSLSTKAQRSLQKLGVEVLLGTKVVEVNNRGVALESNGNRSDVEARTILWAAGIEASPVAKMLQSGAGAQLDSVGRVLVRPDLSVESAHEVMVLGDLAAFTHQGGAQLPGVAQNAIQMGKYAASRVKRELVGKSITPYRYRDKGNLAVIGRNSAVYWRNNLRLAGFPAWLLWAGVHIAYLIGFDNRLLVMLQWCWSYLTYNKGARLILEKIKPPQN